MQPVTNSTAGSEHRLADQAIAHAPCRYRARARWNGQVVAETTAAVRVEELGHPAALYFPLADVRWDAFEDAGRRRTCPVKGGARLWSLPGAPDPADVAAVTWIQAESAVPADGQDVLCGFDQPAPGLEWLAGLVAFDHERVRVEVVDEREGDDERDVTLKRFPTWGDAADLIDILNVRPDGPGRYTSVTLADPRRPVVEGSQMLGQAVVVAGRHAPGRRVVSAHMVFYRAADAREPLVFEVEDLSGGRSFTTLAVHVLQGGRRRASGTLLLDVTAPDLIRHEDVPPPCAGPYESVPYDMGVTGRDVRMVDGAYTDAPDDPAGPPVIDSWVRFRQVPADPCLHAGLLAQYTGHISIAAALRPHEGVSQLQAHRTLSMGINAIGISFHADVRADEWMRYHHHSTFAGDGMTHSECRVYGERQQLVASFTVDAMVRGFPGGGQADGRTAI